MRTLIVTVALGAADLVRQFKARVVRRANRQSGPSSRRDAHQAAEILMLHPALVKGAAFDQLFGS